QSDAIFIDTVRNDKAGRRIWRRRLTGHRDGGYIAPRTEARGVAGPDRIPVLCLCHRASIGELRRCDLLIPYLPSVAACIPATDLIMRGARSRSPGNVYPVRAVPALQFDLDSRNGSGALLCRRSRCITRRYG